MAENHSSDQRENATSALFLSQKNTVVLDHPQWIRTSKKTTRLLDVVGTFDDVVGTFDDVVGT